MATTINSNTTDGLVITPDTSGEVKIQSNGTDVVTFDSSGMNMASGMTLPASNLTGALPAIDGSALTGISSTNVISGEVVFFSNSQINGGTTYVNGPFADFRYATGMRVSGSHTKLSATSDIIMMSTYCCRNTSGNFHAMAVWCDAGNTTNLFRNTPFDPYHMQQNRPTFTTVATFSGLSAGSHTYNVCAGRGDTSSGTGTVNYNPQTTYGPLINTNSYTSIAILEVET